MSTKTIALLAAFALVILHGVPAPAADAEPTASEPAVKGPAPKNPSKKEPPGKEPAEEKPAPAVENTAPEGWTDDFEAAKTQAAKEGKDLLLDFTGSDWCGWCVKLRNEVFEQEAFKKEAPKNYVLVELDFPHDKPLPKKIQAQNKRLEKEFSIEGFPTILLLDSSGKAYARTGYRAGGGEKYLAHLKKMTTENKAIAEALARAEKQEGIEKAKSLSAATEILSGNAALITDEDAVGKNVEKILELDPKDEAGLKKKWMGWKTLQEIAGLIQNGDGGAALAKIETYLADHSPAGAEKQKALIFKAMALSGQQDPEGNAAPDLDGTLAALKAALAADPGSEIVENMQLDKQIAALEAHIAKEKAPPSGKEEGGEEEKEEENDGKTEP